MNLYETEALTFDPESRRGESTAADVYFFLLVFCSPPVWVKYMCMVPFFMESYGKKKNKQGVKNPIRLLCFIHFMLEPVEALLHQEALHMNTLIGTRRELEGRKRRLLAIISCQAAFQEMVNLWDHDASLSWMCFITCWRTIQPILFKMISFLTRLICTSLLSVSGVR